MAKPWAEIAGERRLARRTEKAAVLLRERRLARKLTQAAIAKELGVTANTVARWERCEVPIPHLVAPYLNLQRRVEELALALAEKNEAQKKLRATIEAKNIELQVEKAMRRAPTADQLYRRLCKAFSVAEPTALSTINEIYLSLTKPSKTIDVELYSVDSPVARLCPQAIAT